MHQVRSISPERMWTERLPFSSMRSRAVSAGPIPISSRWIACAAYMAARSFGRSFGKREEKGPALGERGRVGSPLPEHMGNFLDSVRSRKATKTSGRFTTSGSSCFRRPIGRCRP